MVKTLELPQDDQDQVPLHLQSLRLKLRSRYAVYLLFRSHDKVFVIFESKKAEELNMLSFYYSQINSRHLLHLGTHLVRI